MLRKYSFILLALHLSVPSQGQEGKLRIVATTSMIADMIQQIAGAAVGVECIVPIGADPHIYDATPKDAQMIHQADLIFRNGLTFEGWLNELIANAGSDAEVITVTEGIEAIESLQYDNATDPHAWMDASLGLIYILNIRDALITHDPQNKDHYRQNHKRYHDELKQLDQDIMTAIASIPEPQRILITSHDAFQYYGRRYGIRLESVLGTSTDADVQTSDIMRLNQVIQEHDIPALFVESTINPKILEQIAADQDVVIGGKLFADSLGDQDSGAGTYQDMLRHNTNVIVKALMRPGGKSKASEDIPTGSKAWLYGMIIGICLVAFVMLAKRIV